MILIVAWVLGVQLGRLNELLARTMRIRRFSFQILFISLTNLSLMYAFTIMTGNSPDPQLRLAVILMITTASYVSWQRLARFRREESEEGTF